MAKRDRVTIDPVEIRREMQQMADDSRLAYLIGLIDGAAGLDRHAHIEYAPEYQGGHRTGYAAYIEAKKGRKIAQRVSSVQQQAGKRKAAGGDA